MSNLQKFSVFVDQRNCKLVICYFEKKHVIYARNLQGLNSAKSVASAAQLQLGEMQVDCVTQYL